MSGLKETELAKKVIRYLEAFEWEVFKEVADGSRIADIVARRGPIIWVIEVKKVASLSVLEQAHYWLAFAHQVSVCVPIRSRSRTGWMFERCAQHFGIGVLRGWGEIQEVVRPATRHRLRRSLEGRLCEEQKTFAEAGNNDGSYWSPWKQTMRGCAAVVTANPGCTLKELITSVNHHYCNDKSAAGAIRHWAWHGSIPGVEVRCEGRCLRFYPKEKKEKHVSKTPKTQSGL